MKKCKVGLGNKEISRQSLWSKLLSYKVQFFCVVFGFLLYLLASKYANSENLIMGHQIKREDYGKYSKDVRLEVEGIHERKENIEIEVSKKEYSKEEVLEVFEVAMEYLSNEILAENSSLSEVKTDLYLPTRIEKFGLRAVWLPEDVDLIDVFGKVNNADLTKRVDTLLKVELSDGRYKENFVFNLGVLPRDYTVQEKAVKEFKDYIRSIDEQSVGEEYLTLPTQWNGRALTYKDRDGMNYSILWILGVVIAALLYIRDIVNVRTVMEQRTKQYMEDYPEIVSKFMILIGAGISVRGAWEIIVNDYIHRDNPEIRVAYQGMEAALSKLRTGMSETKVLKDFGRETGQKQYMKLVGLLEQNKKSGSAGLKQALSLEAISAWEERLSLARRQGEEASTKLLGPLFIMLGIVMFMIIAPAMMTFY